MPDRPGRHGLDRIGTVHPDFAEKRRLMLGAFAVVMSVCFDAGSLAVTQAPVSHTRGAYLALMRLYSGSISLGSLVYSLCT